jgi:probable HAF family extracellular repeat protein
MKKYPVFLLSMLMLPFLSCEKSTDVIEPPSEMSETEVHARTPILKPSPLNSPFSRGFGINNAGVVAGSAENREGVVVAFAYPQQGGLSGQDVWFSAEPVAADGLPTVRFCINDRGDIAGHKLVQGGIAPVLWRNGHTIDLPVLPGFEYGEVFDMNASGLMVGECLNGNYVNPSSLRATVFTTDGQVIDIGTLGGKIASAAGTNDRGDIVGFAETTVPGQTRAFLYRRGFPMMDLGTLGGPWSNANAINNKGEIVGRSVLANGTSIRGFLYRGGQMINIGTLGGNSCVAVDINDNSEIVGFSRISSGPFHAFLYKNGVMTDLGALLPGNDSRAMQINNRGDVTGYYTKPDGTIHAFLYRNGVMIEL